MHAADELQFFADLSKLKHANVADYRRTASAGSPVRTASFFRSACSRACFRRLFLMGTGRR